MKILVTGGAGFIGSHLVDALIREGHQVRVYDNLDSQAHKDDGLPTHFNEKAEFVKGDVRHKKELQKAIGNSQVIFHLAAVISLGQSMYRIKEYEEVNLGGIANLLEILASTRNRVKKIVFASSATVYGEGAYFCPREKVPCYPDVRTEEQVKGGQWEELCPVCHEVLTPIPTIEEKPLSAKLIYAITKEAGEKMLSSFAQAYGVPCTVLRYFNVYGPGQNWHNPHTAVWASFLGRIKNDLAPLIIEDGKQTRDFVYVKDVVRATIKAMEMPKNNFEIINIGSGKRVSVLQVAEKLIELSGKNLKPEITYIFRKGDVRHCFADITKAKKLLNWEPQVSFEEGAKKMFEWGIKQKTKVSSKNFAQELVERGVAVYGKKISN